MNKIIKRMSLFVFTLLLLIPLSVFAIDISQEDFDTAKGGTPTKGITYSEGDFEVYSFDEGEYKFTSDINIENGIIFVNEKNVTFDLNGKTLTGSNSVFGNIVIYGKSVSTITGNGTITNGYELEDEFMYGSVLLVDSGAVLNIENGTFNGAVYATGFSEEEEITYSYINIKNGTFKDSLMLENANAVVDDASFDVATRDAIYVNSGASIEINGGTFKSASNGLMAEPSMVYDNEQDDWVNGPNAKSVIINGGIFTGTAESGLSAFGLDNLEINGGTFTGGMAGFGFETVEKIVVKGAIFKANGEEPVGGIVAFGDNEELLTAILGEGCEFNPDLVTTVNSDYNTIASQNEISVVDKSKNDYKFTEGENLEYDPSKDESATFRINTEYRYFENGGKVFVDEELVDDKNYSSKSGSTIIEFTKEYMASLKAGEHTLKVVFNNNKEATTKFTIKEKNDSTTNPQTGDNIINYVLIGLMSMIGLSSIIYLKKREN